MSVEQALVAVCTAVVGVLAVLVMLSAREVARLRREVDDLRSGLEVSAPRRDTGAATRTEGDRTPVADGGAPDDAFVITGMGDGASATHDAAPVPARIEGRLFADILARETVVKTAGLVHGLRRAASPEVRNRVRFEMRQELKRTRRRRRADLKEALRDLRRRQREAGDPSCDDQGTAA